MLEEKLIKVKLFKKIISGHEYFKIKRLCWIETKYNYFFFSILSELKKEKKKKGFLNLHRWVLRKTLARKLSKHRDDQISPGFRSVRARRSSSMAMFLKRSFSYRNFLLLRNFANPSRNLSFFVNDLCNSWTSEMPGAFALPPADFIRESRRGFAKGRKSSNRLFISYYAWSSNHYFLWNRKFVALASNFHCRFDFSLNLVEYFVHVPPASYKFRFLIFALRRRIFYKYGWSITWY